MIIHDHIVGDVGVVYFFFPKKKKKIVVFFFGPSTSVGDPQKNCIKLVAFGGSVSHSLVEHGIPFRWELGS